MDTPKIYGRIVLMILNQETKYRRPALILSAVTSWRLSWYSIHFPSTKFVLSIVESVNEWG